MLNNSDLSLIIKGIKQTLVQSPVYYYWCFGKSLSGLEQYISISSYLDDAQNLNEKRIKTKGKKV